LGTLEQYWRKASATLHHTFRRQAAQRPRLEELERELLALSAGQQELGGTLERIRSEYQQQHAEQQRRLQGLERDQQQAASARSADAGELAGVQQRLAEIDTRRAQEHERITALDASLTQVTHRLETRLNQLKFLQDSAREQFGALKTALAESNSRLEARDNELRQLQESAGAQTAALEAALAEVTAHFEPMAGELRELRGAITDQRLQFEGSLAATDTQLQAANNRLEALEQQFKTGQRLEQNRFEDLQAQLRRQERRLKGTLLIAALVVLLVALAGAMRL
jgi:chromosome segregation ATPase